MHSFYLYIDFLCLWGFLHRSRGGLSVGILTTVIGVGKFLVVFVDFALYFYVPSSLTFSWFAVHTCSIEHRLSSLYFRMLWWLSFTSFLPPTFIIITLLWFFVHTCSKWTPVELTLLWLVAVLIRILQFSGFNFFHFPPSFLQPSSFST